MRYSPAMPSDYQRVGLALEFLESRAHMQPALDDLAHHLGLSPAHCHKLFHRWAGLTPKDFVQLVTLARAKDALQRPASVLDAALDSGLSGPGRLHDLFVLAEAMTPGEYARGGAGLCIRWGVHETPLGWTLFLATTRGLCGLEFLEGEGGAGADAEAARVARARWPAAEVVHDPGATVGFAEAVNAALRGAPAGPLPVVLGGTPFQCQVWLALLRIPAGRTASYGDVAEAVGRPAASRAVGGAVGANRISILIPCHRVLRSSGALGGYRWGETRKRLLLALEKRPAA